LENVTPGRRVKFHWRPLAEVVQFWARIPEKFVELEPL
jgi:hypothetical protein